VPFGHGAFTEIIDFDISNRNYFGIVRKASFDCERIGRIVGLERWVFGWMIENLQEKDIKWQESS
jgi:hypothetical protein